jgi:hypothetical protein
MCEIKQPKEKAKTLFQKMVYEIEYNCQPSIVQMVAKKLTIITIDEMIGELSRESADDSCSVEYWQEVKNEVLSF